MNEIEVVRDVLSETTGAPFRIDSVRENRLLLKNQADWLVWCGDFAYVERTRPLKAAWKNKDGHVWLETSEIADMIALVQRYYGEKGVGTMPEVKPGVPTGGFPEEVMGYPQVVDTLRRYQDTVSRVSKEHGVELKLLYDGGVGVTTVRIGARMDDNENPEALKGSIKRVASALREAYDEVLETGPP